MFPLALKFIIIFYGLIGSYFLGKRTGFREGLDFCDKSIDEELLKRWKSLNENRPD